MSLNFESHTILKCIAICHDLIEDTSTTYSELKQLGCDDEIVEAVRCLTKLETDTDEDSLNRVLSNTHAMLVKLADLEDNSNIFRLRELTDKDIIRLKKYHKWYNTIWDKLYKDYTLNLLNKE